jgi:hypothetical protein
VAGKADIAGKNHPNCDALFSEIGLAPIARPEKSGTASVASCAPPAAVAFRIGPAALAVASMRAADPRMT